MKTQSDDLSSELAIDLFPYKRQGDRLEILYFDWNVLESEYLGEPLKNSAGQKIPALSLESIERIKKLWHPEKWYNQIDLEQINKYLEK
jgi:hypothetical protein